MNPDDREKIAVVFNAPANSLDTFSDALNSYDILRSTTKYSQFLLTLKIVNLLFAHSNTYENKWLNHTKRYTNFKIKKL